MTTEPPPIKAGENARKPRQALILIHGIGEQRPMGTLRGFVDAVLDQSNSDSQADAKYYSKPDFMSDNLELRRLVSARGRDNRTDFFEFYWAHLMPTATWDRLASWYWMLMHRKPKDVPRRLLTVWGISWAMLVVVILLGVATSIRFLSGHPLADGPLMEAPWFFLLALGALSALIRSYIGDAAVYLSPAPENIEARQKIRAAGLNLLDKIAASGRYDRIIVVGHSLGSVIGYDILTFAWQRHVDATRARMTRAWANGEYPPNATQALREAEVLTKRIRDDKSTDPATLAAYADDWRPKQRSLASELRANGDDWLVTDFVTLGSPLAHGDMLLASNRRDFERRARERELPHCPPVRELKGRFSFDCRGTDNQGRMQRARILNHAALFAPTAWTNLYFPARWLLIGDIIGGPIAPLFWAGVRDIPVRTKFRGSWLAHTLYWRRDARDTDEATNPVKQLRKALRLNNEDDSTSGLAVQGNSMTEVQPGHRNDQERA